MDRTIEHLKEEIKKLKNENEILRSSKTFFEDVVERSKIGVFIFHNEVLSYANPSFLEMFGYTYNEAVDMKRPHDLVHPDDLAKLAQSYENGEEIINKPRIIEYKFIKKSGEEFYGETFTISSMYGGEASSIGGTIIDVTKKIDLKRSLNNKKIALDEVLDNIQTTKNDQKANFEKNISEILTPIINKMMLNNNSKHYAILLQSSLDEICTKFGINLSKQVGNLTSTERELCLMIKSGLTSKEIAKLQNKSYLTIEKQRKVLRKKLNISGEVISLESYLNSLSNSLLN